MGLNDRMGIGVDCPMPDNEYWKLGPVYQPTLDERRRVRELLASTRALLAAKKEGSDHDPDHDL